MGDAIYSVYLVRTGEKGNRVRGGEREVTSPVEGHELDFYDSGVWLTRETGRNFFPYDQIRTIREHPEGADGQRGARDQESSDASGRNQGGEVGTDAEEDASEA